MSDEEASAWEHSPAATGLQLVTVHGLGWPEDCDKRLGLRYPRCARAERHDAWRATSVGSAENRRPSCQCHLACRHAALWL